MTPINQHKITTRKQLSDVWLKAAILGATWAASEIILGSFLHNLRIPFNGNILTAIGLILMISASFIWKDKGLFWRTGLICALMKTLSPSAIIFGPMIAIFAEAILMELSIRTLGRNLLGYGVGASLAMSWILVQKVANMIIFYGFNIVEIYTNLMGFAERQLNIHFDLFWMPIIALLVLYIIFGLIAVWIGVSIGKRLQTQRSSVSIKAASANAWFQPKNSQQFSYSLGWLVVDFILLTGMLLVINNTPVFMWALLTFVVIFLWTKRYKRAIRQLSKPKFWVFFILITMLTAFVMTYIQGRPGMDGLIIGLQMNFRAAIVIVGFAVIGTELYNPKIRAYFAQTSFKQLPVALELAFETLPGVISNLPEVQHFFKRPVSVVSQLMTQAEQRFKDLKQQQTAPLFILTGGLAQGKTTCLIKLIDTLKKSGLKISGFYSPRVLSGTETIGYDQTLIDTGQNFPFLRKDKSKTNTIGAYSIDDTTYKYLQNHLRSIEHTNTQLAIIDEIGRWELEGKGWFESSKLLMEKNIPQLWVVRDIFVDKIIDFYALTQVNIYTIDHSTCESFSKDIINILKEPTPKA